MITNQYAAEQLVRYTQRDRMAAAAAHRLAQEARAARREAEQAQTHHAASPVVRSRPRWLAVFTRALGTAR